MGHDVHNIGSHNLNTSSLEALAKDLSNRFKANIEYGVYDTFPFDWDGFHREASFDYWVFGKIEYPNAEKTLWLTDEFYLHHIVHGRYGNNAYRLPYFTEYNSHKYELHDAINNVCFELRDNYADDEYGTIFNDVFRDFQDYFYSRWWSFCRTFTEENFYGNDWENIYHTGVYEYRKKVMDFFQKIGGSEVFYFDDQGESQYLTETYYDWETIRKEVEIGFKETTLHISEFMKEKKLLPKGKYPKAFYDDFADLKTGPNKQA